MTPFRSRPNPGGVALRLGAAALVVTVLTSLPHSGSRFSASAANSGNSGAAAPSFFRMTSGSYTGDGASSRAVTAGFQPDLVIVKQDDKNPGVLRTSSMVGDYAKVAGGSATPAPNLIRSITATGFTVGSDVDVNGSGSTYQWVAMKGSSNSMVVGTYAGDGTNGRAITGIGFQPVMVLVGSSGAEEWNIRMAGMAASRGYQLDNEAGATNRITSLDTNGFTVNNNNQANGTGRTYFYVAFAGLSGYLQALTYTGTGVDNRAVNGVAFQPGFAWVRDDGGGKVMWRSGSMPANTAYSLDAQASVTNEIKSLTGTGMTVGTGNNANRNGDTYAALFIRNTG